jgi:hypothetical protein
VIRRVVLPDRRFDAGARNADVPEFVVRHRAKRGTRLLSAAHLVPSAPNGCESTHDHVADGSISLLMRPPDDALPQPHPLPRRQMPGIAPGEIETIVGHICLPE